MVVAYNSPREFKEWVGQHPIRPGRHSGSARAALERRTIHIPDVRADPEYTYGAKDAEAIRTILGVPILKGDALLGVMMIYRLEVKPFTDKQIALVETFADQAAIAIDNVRLFEAEQQRSRELAESLEQQTATSEVLKVISRSTFDLQVVLNTLIEMPSPRRKAAPAWDSPYRNALSRCTVVESGLSRSLGRVRRSHSLSRSLSSGRWRPHEQTHSGGRGPAG